MANINTQKAFTTQTGEGNLGVTARGALYDLQSQINRQTAVKAVKNKRPKGMKDGDSTTRLASGGGVAIAIYDGKGGKREAIFPSDMSRYVAYSEGTTAPDVTQFPKDGNWGFYFNTSVSKLFIIRNRKGTLIYPDIAGFSGTITSMQHGDLSGYVMQMHDFTQLAGQITDAQHGNLSAVAAIRHSFIQISGTITTTQHGNLTGTGGTKHDFTQIFGLIDHTQHGDLSGYTETHHDFPEISGNITGTQHGDLSGYGGTSHAMGQISGSLDVTQHGALSGFGGLSLHDFTQISGGISAGQHGNLSAAIGTAHAMGQISGSLTISQHGALSDGGLHAIANSGTAGFMSSADKIKLDAAATAPTASTLVMRGTGGGVQGAGVFSTDSFWTGPAGSYVKVVGTQGGAISNAVNSAAAPTMAEFNAHVAVTNAILARIRAATGHGLIA